ncbi:hypothetical protein C0557_04015 [Kosakonia sp. MUSA4]|nr:hypothetical protein C0557_04015 [Kosakonia sp. MUSA4]
MICNTLASLARNIIYINEKHHVKYEIKICIIFDGIANISGDTAIFLESLGYELNNTGHNELYPMLTLSEKKFASPELLRQCADYTDNKHVVGSDHEINCILALKSENRGKLDSHAWMFLSICEQLNPRYILQVDAGTVPATSCLLNLLCDIESHPDYAAIAAYLLPKPNFFVPVHKSWQYSNFVWDKINFWPVGYLLGYLEVIPGACSLIRWEAVNNGNPGQLPPLSNYFRGLSPAGLLQKNLYLAEDRVLGFEIIKNGDREYKIKFNPTAKVEIDNCNTFSELILQRRRWINSTLSARLYALSQLPGIIVNNNKGAFYKFKIMTSLYLSLINMAEMVLMPAVFSILLFSTFEKLAANLPTWVNLPYISYSAFFFSWVGIIIFDAFVSPVKKYGKILHHLLFFPIFIMFAFCLLTILTNTNLVWFYAVTAFLLIFSLAVLIPTPSSAIHFFKWIFMHFIFDASISFYLTSYALANYNDTSWGTKGLNNNEKKRSTTRKVAWLSCWVIVNMIVSFFLISIDYTQRIFLFTVLSVYIMGRSSLCSVLTLLIYSMKKISRNQTKY